MPKKAFRFKRFYLASLDEVTITRDGDTATIRYIKDNVMTHCLKLGPVIEAMTDQDILDEHNAHIRAAGELAHEYRNKPLTEIPLNRPQVEYFDKGHYWVPRADVLRCIVTSDLDTSETAIIIDDLKFVKRQLDVFFGDNCPLTSVGSASGCDVGRFLRR
ncbi:MAG: hypothetical protein HON70_24190, partial [Lentisphaerae bacterium]|nr:hypothetical protein [Lentisphaerota bacterium]